MSMRFDFAWSFFPSCDEKYLGPLKCPFNGWPKGCCDFAIWFFKQLLSLWALFQSTLSQAAYPCEMHCASFSAIPMSLLVYTFADGFLVTTLIWADDDRKQHETCPLLFLSVLPSAKKNKKVSWMISLWSEATWFWKGAISEETVNSAGLDQFGSHSETLKFLLLYNGILRQNSRGWRRSSSARDEWSYLKFTDFSQPLGIFTRAFFLGNSSFFFWSYGYFPHQTTRVFVWLI